MADFSPSNLVAGQALFNEKFKSAEWRLPDHAAIKVAEKGVIANPSFRDLRTREDRTINYYFPIRQSATSGTSRAFNHTGARGDSLNGSVTWSTYSEPFSISIKQADNNVESWAEMYASTLRNAVLNILNRADAGFVTALLADKTQVNNGGGNGSFNSTPNDFEIDATYKEYYYQEVKAMMTNNLYRGNLIGIVDSKANVLAEKSLAQGSGNSENRSFQFMGYEDIVPTTRTVLSGYDVSGIFFENGLVAYQPWIPAQNRKPLNPEKAMSYNGDMGSISIPELGVDFAIHSYGTRANASSNNGSAQDLVIYQEVSIDFAYISAPLSTFRGSNDSVVYTAGLLT